MTMGGGITIVWREADGWEVEGVQIFGPNVMSFIISLGRERWYRVGAYVSTNALPTVNQITQALECGLKGMGKLLVRDLNTCLENPRDQWEEQLATVLVVHGLTDQARHFVPRQKYWSEGNWTW